jgi:hypothetical protein
MNASFYLRAYNEVTYPMEKYFAVIADIVQSRNMDIPYRIKVQNNLVNKIEELNQVYEDQLAAYIDIASGDQIQALFLKCDDAYNFVCRFRAEMYPVEFRFGIGAGSWDVRIMNKNPQQKSFSNLQDGTAYHMARAAIEKAEKCSHDQITFFSGNDDDAYINILIANEVRIFQGQTDTQKELSQIYDKLFPLNPRLIYDEKKIPTVSFSCGAQVRIAEYIQSTPQNISQNIRRGMIFYQRELRAAVNILMQSSI